MVSIFSLCPWLWFIYRKSLSKGSQYSHGNSSRSSIQMLPIISGLVDKQVPEIGRFSNQIFKIISYFK